tara:strand:+ start:2243 stop:3406 length:1164 start_codon:yes stop_codon:yes gene_type:complete
MTKTQNEVPTMEFEIVPTEAGLELEAKNSLELAFKGFFSRAAEWKKQAESITDSKVARTARLEIRKIRIEAEKKRKELKADALLFGKAVDGANNIFLNLITPIERRLDDIEKAEERRIAAELKAMVEERSNQYTEFHDDSLPYPDLSNLTDEQFSSLLENAKTLKRLKLEELAKLEAERIEKERIEAEEREAQRLENIKLKAEAEEREKAIAKERADAEKLRKVQEAKQAKERAEIKAKLKAEAEEREKAIAKERADAEKLRKVQEAKQAKERAEIKAKLKAEAEEREKVEAESMRLKEAEQARKDKEQADIAEAKKLEAQRIAKEKAEAKKAANAPDKDKLNAFADQVGGLVVPSVAAPEAQLVADEVAQKVANFKAWIKTQASSL